MRSVGIPIALLLSAMPTAAEADSRLKRLFLSQPTWSNETEVERRMLLPSEVSATKSNGSFFASFPVAPNAVVGVGKFVTPPRRRVSLHDQPTSLHPKKVKKAAIGLSLRF